MKREKTRKVLEHESAAAGLLLPLRSIRYAAKTAEGWLDDNVGSVAKCAIRAGQI